MIYIIIQSKKEGGTTMWGFSAGVASPKPAPVRSIKPSPYGAVSIVGPASCCAAAKSLKEERLLIASAPTLPMAQCSMPQQCRCHFEKHADRRTPDGCRRLNDELEASRWYGGLELRIGPGRRSSD